MLPYILMMALDLPVAYFHALFLLHFNLSQSTDIKDGSRDAKGAATPHSAVSRFFFYIYGHTQMYMFDILFFFAISDANSECVCVFLMKTAICAQECSSLSVFNKSVHIFSVTQPQHLL